MAFASFDDRRSGAPMAEINMVPMIDVMLVLLVIFMIAAPLMTRTVPLDLPSTQAPPTTPVALKVDVSINATGALFWDGTAVTPDEARLRLATASQQQPQPALYLHADAAVPYRVVARVLGDAAAAGLHQIGFVSLPESPTP